jgi:hypothetical protein
MYCKCWSNFKASTMHARYRTTSISINQIAATVLPATCKLPAIATASISHLGIIQINIGATVVFSLDRQYQYLLRLYELNQHFQPIDAWRSWIQIHGQNSVALPFVSHTHLVVVHIWTQRQLTRNVCNHSTSIHHHHWPMFTARARVAV